MTLNRRDLLKNIATGGAIGYLGTETRRWGDRVHSALHGFRDSFSGISVEDLVHGNGQKNPEKNTHLDLVRSIAARLGAPEKNIHALLIQERPAGQESDFFEGEAYGQDAGKPAILFERHIFWDTLEIEGKKLGIADLPTLLFRATQHDGSALSKTPYVDSSKYKYGKSSEQYGKLRMAYDWGKQFAQDLATKTGKDASGIQKAIEDASLMACSWGAGQVLGINYVDLGYDSVRELAEKATTVNGMAENFSRFVEKHYSNKGKKGYLAELKKSHPDWKAIAIYHNGSNVAQTNPRYIGNIENYARGYKSDTATDMKDIGTNIVVGGSIGTLIGYIGEKIKNALQKNHNTGKTISRRRMMKLATLGSIGTIIGDSLSRAGFRLPSFEFSGGKKERENTGVAEFFNKKTQVSVPTVPTKIQTTILDPWLEKNKRSVQRFKTIKESKTDPSIEEIAAETEHYKCEGLGSALLENLAKRRQGNHEDYLYLHREALKEIDEIATILNEKAKNICGMQAGCSLRLIISSALRDGEYSKRFLGNSSPNSTHNTGRAFDIALRFEIRGPDGKYRTINHTHDALCSNLVALLAQTLNEKHKKDIYFMREGNPPHFHCVALAGTKL